MPTEKKAARTKKTDIANKGSQTAQQHLPIVEPRSTSDMEKPRSSTDSNSRKRAKSHDPVTRTLSIVAIVISLLGVGISIWTTAEQRRQWRATTLGAVGVDEMDLIPFRRIPATDIEKIKWGYPPDVRLEMFQDSSGYAQQVSALVPFERDGTTLISNVFAFTVPEMKTKLADRGLKLEEIALGKKFILQLHFKKFGTTVARGLVVFAATKDPETGLFNELSRVEFGDLYPENVAKADLHYFGSPNESVPDFLDVKLKFEFTDVEGVLRSYEELKTFRAVTFDVNAGASR